MSCEILYMPPKPHSCELPSTYIGDGESSRDRYPDGTIIRCNDCGAVWMCVHEWVFANWKRKSRRWAARHGYERGELVGV